MKKKKKIASVVKKKKKPVSVKKGSKRDYNRIIQIIIELNEKIVIDAEEDEDPLWNELASLRKNLDDFQNQVIGRLIPSLSIADIVVEIDEATPGSDAHWKP